MPIYESERAVVHHGDALHVLPGLPTESFGLVVTDPPYGVEWVSGFRSESFGAMAGDGTADRGEVHEVLVHCVRLVGVKRHLYVFGPTDVFEDLKVARPTTLVWDKGKMGAGDLSSSWGPGHEVISFTVSMHRFAGKAGSNALAARLRKGSVLRFSPPTGRKVRHPSEKPVALLREMVESSSRIDEWVLDPYAGSGATAVAALLLGRRTVVVESDERYLGLIVERVKAAERLWAEARSV